MNKIYLETCNLIKIAGFTAVIITTLFFTQDIAAQPPCNGMPQSGNTFAPQNPVCPGTSFTVILLGAPAQSGLVYQWFSSPDGINIAPIQGANTPQLQTSELQPAYYNCRVTCMLSGQSNFSVPLLVNLTLPVIQYPSATVQLNNGESKETGMGNALAGGAAVFRVALVLLLPELPELRELGGGLSVRGTVPAPDLAEALLFLVTRHPPLTGMTIIPCCSCDTRSAFP